MLLLVIPSGGCVAAVCVPPPPDSRCAAARRKYISSSSFLLSFSEIPLLVLVPIPISARVRIAITIPRMIFIRAPFRQRHSIHFHFACHSQCEYPPEKLVNALNCAPAGNLGRHRSSFGAASATSAAAATHVGKQKHERPLFRGGSATGSSRPPRLMPSPLLPRPPPGPFPQGTVRGHGGRGQEWGRGNVKLSQTGRGSERSVAADVSTVYAPPSFRCSRSLSVCPCRAGGTHVCPIRPRCASPAPLVILVECDPR